MLERLLNEFIKSHKQGGLYISIQRHPGGNRKPLSVTPENVVEYSEEYLSRSIAEKMKNFVEDWEDLLVSFEAFVIDSKTEKVIETLGKGYRTEPIIYTSAAGKAAMEEAMDAHVKEMYKPQKVKAGKGVMEQIKQANVQPSYYDYGWTSAKQGITKPYKNK